MSFRIYTACRIEQFLDRFPEVFLPDSILGASRRLVIQNRNMGEWLKLTLADRQGISAGLDILFPEQALRVYMDHFDHPYKEKTVLFMDNLKVVLFQKLKADLQHPQEIYRPLNRYLESGASEGRELRLYQLADVLAGLFYHYGMNCQELTESWDRGELYGKDLLPEHQSWQMQLWQELFNQESSFVHLSRILTDIRLHKRKYNGPGDHLQLFGSSFLGETGIRFFKYLSEFLPVDFYYVIPSSLFAQENIHGDQDVPENVQVSDWLEWAAMARGLSDILAEFPRGEDLPPPSFPAHRLGRFQETLWYNRAFPLGEEIPEDESIRIFSAVSPRRQVEVLKDQLLRLLDEDQSLQLSQICVMAPDIQPFASHLEEVFQRGGEESRLPCHFIDLQGQSDASYTQGFLKLLELAGSRYSRSEIFALFQNPCFARAASIDEGLYRLWLERCEELNILWGMDGTHRKSLGLETGETNTWEWGFRRILLGFYYSNEEEHPDYPYTEGPESEQSDLGKLIHLVRCLYKDLKELTSGTLPLAVWVKQSEALMERYLQPRKDVEQDDLDRLAVKAVFRNMNNMIDGLRLQAEERCSWTFFYELLKESLKKTGRKKGRYLSQGISCSSLKPLRGIPFRIICLLGMDFGSFPSLEEHWNFDMRDRIRPAIDLSRRSSDRFSFLETVISARDRLFVFYQGRDQVSGEDLLPSSLVSEWMEMLRFSEDSVLQLPLQPQDPLHFLAGSPLRSYDKEHWLGALRLQNHREGPLPLPSLSLGTEDIEELTFFDLTSFLKDPLKQYSRHRLNLQLDLKGDLLEEHQDESYELSFLEEGGLLDSLTESLLRGEEQDPDRLIDGLRRRGSLSRSSWDEASIDSLRDRLITFRDSLEDIRSELTSWTPRTLEFHPDPSAQIRRGEQSILPAPVVQTRFGSVRITGSVPGFQKEGGSHLELSYLYGNSYKSRYSFQGFLHFLMLQQAGFHQQKIRFFGRSGDYPSKGWETSNLADSPEVLLRTWVEACLENRQNPLLLYPDHCDRILKGGKNWEKTQSPGEFAYLYRQQGNSFKSPSDLESSPYKELFFPDRLPDLTREWTLMRKLYPYFLEVTPGGGT